MFFLCCFFQHYAFDIDILPLRVIDITIQPLQPNSGKHCSVELESEIVIGTQRCKLHLHAIQQKRALFHIKFKTENMVNTENQNSLLNKTSTRVAKLKNLRTQQPNKGL